MTDRPTRTGLSNLTDDELLLLDLLFDSNASLAKMSHSAYSVHMNCNYSHSLDDQGLASTIQSLVTRQLIHPIGNSIQSDCPTYSLTQLGGRSWECERQPDWSRYVSTSHRIHGSFSTSSIVATCRDETVGRQCLGAMFGAGLITPTSPIRVRKVWNCRVIPWTTFDDAYALRCRTLDKTRNNPHTIDWQAYDQN